MEMIIIIFHLHDISTLLVSVVFKRLLYGCLDSKHTEVVHLTFPPHIFSVIMTYTLNKIQLIFYEEEMSIRLYAQV